MRYWLYDVTRLQYAVKDNLDVVMIYNDNLNED